MAWDFAIDPVTGDMTGGYVAGQDEILQRITTRLLRHLGEWFLNTSAGLPWYEGPSTIMAGQLTRDNAILGGKDFKQVDRWVRNEIAETDGVIQILDFTTSFASATREYSIKAIIATEYGSADYKLDYPLTA